MEETKIKANSCNTCGSENTYGMSRIVGYYSMVDNWNDAKQAEYKDRQKGDYKLGINVDNWGKPVQEVLIVV